MTTPIDNIPIITNRTIIADNNAQITTLHLSRHTYANDKLLYLNHLYSVLSIKSRLLVTNELHRLLSVYTQKKQQKEVWILLRIQYYKLLSYSSSSCDSDVCNTDVYFNTTDIESKDVDSVLLVELKHNPTDVESKIPGSPGMKQKKNTNRNKSDSYNQYQTSIWQDDGKTEVYLNICFKLEAINSFDPVLVYQNKIVEGDRLISDIAMLWTKYESRFYGKPVDRGLHFLSMIITELVTIGGYHLIQSIESVRALCNKNIDIFDRISQNIITLRSLDPSPTQSIDVLRDRLRDRLTVSIYSKLNYPTITELSSNEIRGYNCLFPTKYIITPLWVVKSSTNNTPDTRGNITYIKIDNTSKTPITLDDMLSKLTDMHYYTTFVLFDSIEQAKEAVIVLIRRYHQSSNTIEQGIDGNIEIQILSSGMRNKVISTTTVYSDHSTDTAQKISLSPKRFTIDPLSTDNSSDNVEYRISIPEPPLTSKQKGGAVSNNGSITPERLSPGHGTTESPFTPPIRGVRDSTTDFSSPPRRPYSTLDAARKLLSS